jgi:hypothetical protein
MNWLDFAFGDYDSPQAREYLSCIGKIISISNYIDEEIREIFHEFLFNQHYEVTAIVFDNLRNIDQRIKIIKSMGKRSLPQDLQSELNAILAKIKSVSEKRNSVAHSVLGPKNDGSEPHDRIYIMRKAAIPYFEQKIKPAELEPLSETLMTLAKEIF